jgi:hypothetical protein
LYVFPSTVNGSAGTISAVVPGACSRIDPLVSITTARCTRGRACAASGAGSSLSMTKSFCTPASARR